MVRANIGNLLETISAFALKRVVKHEIGDKNLPLSLPRQGQIPLSRRYRVEMGPSRYSFCILP